MSAPAAPRRPRLLQRPVSPAQREAARRRDLYARLHLFNAEEAQAFRAEIRDLFDSMNPRCPLALALVSQLAFAAFQLRRAFGLEIEFVARNPQDIDAVLRQVLAIGAFESRYSRLFYRASTCLENLDKQAAERIALKKISGKRTPELIENKEKAPAHHSRGADRQVCGPGGALWARPASIPPARLAISGAQVRTAPMVSFPDERTPHFNVANPENGHILSDPIRPLPPPAVLRYTSPQNFREL